MKITILFTGLLFYSAISFSQDTIITKMGEEIKVKVKEVTESTVSYYKFDNLSGPLHTKSLAEIFQIKYENGSVETYNRNATFLTDSLITKSRDTTDELLKKGNSVFIQIPDEASRAGEKYFVDALRKWGYWKIVSDSNDAHVIIEFNIEKKPMLDKSAWVVFKTRELQEFKKSESYRSITSVFNGYNAFRSVSQLIVNNYLKKNFK